MQFTHHSFVKLFAQAPNRQLIVKPGKKEDIRTVFGQLVKQLYGYLHAQGTILSPAEVFHHLKDFHMIKNFLYWIKFDLWYDWEIDFLPLIVKDNVAKIVKATY